MTPTMDIFKKLETSMYVCHTVSSTLWDREGHFQSKGIVVFDNEDDAKKCLDILDIYKAMFNSLGLSNELKKTMFTFDGKTIHLLSGITIDYEENLTHLKRIAEIERKFAPNTWGYMDNYVRLFGYPPMRIRSSWISFLLCISCSYLFCCIDPFRYEVKNHRT